MSPQGEGRWLAADFAMENFLPLIMHDLSKLVPMDLKFGTETKFNMENPKIKEKLEIDSHLINYT